MGSCVSVPFNEDLSAGKAGAAGGRPLPGRAPSGAAHTGLAAAAAPPLDPAPRDALPSSELGVIAKVHELQQALALLSTNPLLALPDAAEVLAAHLGVDAVGVYAFANDAVPTAVLMGTHGAAAAALERRPVTRGATASVCGLYASRGGSVVVLDAAQEEGLPADFQALLRDGGMRSLAAISIGAPGGAAPLGALVVACREAGRFDASWCSVWLAAAATGLLQHLRSPLVALAAQLLRMIDDAPDRIGAISALLQSGAKFMHAATNIASMRVRLALVEPGATSALLFETARAPAARWDSAFTAAAAKGASVPLPLDPAADVAVRELPLANTLLESALSLRKARFVRDTAAFLQNARDPARDVFTHASAAVASVCCVPLLVGDTPFGALYLTQEAACDFLNIQEALLGFVHCVTLLLHHKLAGQAQALRCLAEQASREPRSCDVLAGAHLIRQLDSDDSEDSASASSSDDLVPPLASGSMSGRLSKVPTKRLCTEAMLKVLQQEIRRSSRRSVEMSFVGDHLMLHKRIAQGGFSRVYLGSWHGRTAAVKVMNARASDREAVSDAMEMAVLSSLGQHPNVVAVYSCLTDMAVTGGSGGGGGDDCGAAARPASPPRFRRALPDEELDAPTFNIVVMEFCDGGSLGDAVRRLRVFHRQLDNGAVGVDAARAVQVLAEVASALAHMHRASLLHGDVKLENVLLKSDPLAPLGFAPKLADFGLTRIIRESEAAINHSGAGTITHLAPELFFAGSCVTDRVDSYAFGITMWEIYTAQRPYAGLTREAIGDLVRRGGRPAFPPGTPSDYARLASDCWAALPTDRPPMSEVVARLRRMSEGIAAATAAAGAAGGAAASAAAAAAAASAAAAAAVAATAAGAAAGVAGGTAAAP
ncbi:hypothetical protein Rsub_12704 [Raphidocelis subcapitata]|uniref:Protein kinase domain-containing protein n=1 Tax=Raphidocelis subcapitata TaxID=307507 RepID=A0A2V0PK97_9CHLO|nr:hypothetical protein Rsub_12704 [Raphidocelis subcapitata]|eukprot:GBG00219.1 hypothetical protein Rsub_12704 [Raphidocelis subcapitata]